jgi:predicted transcriptional regulator
MEDRIICLTANIVSAHTMNNEVSAAQLPGLIRHVHQALTTAGQTPVEPMKSKPAVDVKKSVFGDHIVCLVCGKSFKTLKRHLLAEHQMTPEQYRTKWNLPPTYAIVAPEYAERRAQLAKDSGLGRKDEAPPPPKTRGRPRGG